MRSFNLIDQTWIPVRARDGTTTQVGLLEALTKAHEFSELYDPSPLVTASLHRLLLAVLHRNFGPADETAWMAIWNAGRFDATTVRAYCEKWRGRFDLFDGEHPFLQVGPITGAKEHPAHLLALEAAAGNNATLFDHNFDESPAPLEDAEVARLLVARQAYFIGFGKSEPIYFQDSTMIRGLSVLALGTSLFETLMLNLLPYTDQRPFPWQGRDLPAWEQDDFPTPCQEGNVLHGYLDYLTWRSRRIHLIPDPNGGTARLQLQQGLKLPNSVHLDPFKVYKKNQEGGWSAVGFSPDRAVWRDSHTLFRLGGDDFARPAVFDWLASVHRMRRRGKIVARQAYSFCAQGLATEVGNAANVILWRHERLPLPLHYLEDDGAILRDRLEEALHLAQETAKLLREQGWRMAQVHLFPHTGAGSLSRVQRQDVDKLAKVLAVERSFWPALEAPFKEFLTALPPQVVAGPDDEIPEALAAWAEVVRSSARRAFDQAAERLGLDANAIKAAAQARPFFDGKLAGLTKPYRKEEAHVGA